MEVNNVKLCMQIEEIGETEEADGCATESELLEETNWGMLHNPDGRSSGRER